MERQLTFRDHAAEPLLTRLLSKRPSWVVGSISPFDARFLFQMIQDVQCNVAIEIGTASGLSAAVLCLALQHATTTRGADPDFVIATYDISRTFYADKSKQVGDAAKEMLSPEQVRHVVFQNPATAADAGDERRGQNVRFAFIDASHNHPWPTLDFLAILDCLAEGSVVVFHDINLPLINDAFQAWGAKYLFDSLDLPKILPSTAPDVLPNIGAVEFPADKRRLRENLLDVLFAFEWQVEVDKKYLARLGVKESRRAGG